MTTMMQALTDFGGPVASWLLTYWVHSTLLLGTSWILGRWVLEREAWREAMWKAALLGGLVTAAVSTATLGPLGFRFAIPFVGQASAAVAEGIREGLKGGALAAGLENA